LPAKTNTDLIGELREAVAILSFRADTTDVKLGQARRLLEDIKEQRDRLIKLEVKLEQMEKQRTEEHGKSWAIKLAIVSALIGSGVTILTQIVSRYLPIKKDARTG
jgi:hypothetical protein